MEVDEVLNQFGHTLSELIKEVRKDQTPNRQYNKDIDPDYQVFLPPLIPLVRSGNQHLTISAGALRYPDTSFSEQISRCLPDQSKGGPGAVYNHCLYFVTHTCISQTQIASWSDDQDQDQNRSQSPITSFGSDHKHEDISNSGSGKDSNGDDKEGSDDGDTDSKMVYSCQLRSHHYISSIDSSDASLLKPGPSMSQVIDIEDSSEDEDNVQQRRQTVASSEPGTPPALANDDNKMSNMFSSMATVSNDPTILVNPYELKSFTF
ncbi:hypothetical protein Moror_15871 [Moniliophthora roreri MCA 2997]|uniref:Uncharacterized protein n=1 Tax=Moniliophthora roreri (strain MCA 2997) TaxID=1381753 RepID=V2WL49_MONRO|nr:hypothetical protein Moror_15871 [Moniliophthora roreri MCA 2997]